MSHHANPILPGLLSEPNRVTKPPKGFKPPTNRFILVTEPPKKTRKTHRVPPSTDAIRARWIQKHLPKANSFPWDKFIVPEKLPQSPYDQETYCHQNAFNVFCTYAKQVILRNPEWKGIPAPVVWAPLPDEIKAGWKLAVEQKYGEVDITFSSISGLSETFTRNPAFRSQDVRKPKKRRLDDSPARISTLQEASGGSNSPSATHAAGFTASRYFNLGGPPPVPRPALLKNVEVRRSADTPFLLTGELTYPAPMADGDLYLTQGSHGAHIGEDTDKGPYSEDAFSAATHESVDFGEFTHKYLNGTLLFDALLSDGLLDLKNLAFSSSDVVSYPTPMTEGAQSPAFSMVGVSSFGHQRFTHTQEPTIPSIPGIDFWNFESDIDSLFTSRGNRELAEDGGHSHPEPSAQDVTEEDEFLGYPTPASIFDGGDRFTLSNDFINIDQVSHQKDTNTPELDIGEALEPADSFLRTIGCYWRTEEEELSVLQGPVPDHNDEKSS